MLNKISIAIGLCMLLSMFITFLPFFGWLNWFTIPIILLGIGLGIISDESTGVYLNGFILLVAVFRLSIGSGCI